MRTMTTLLEGTDLIVICLMADDAMATARLDHKEVEDRMQ